MIPWLGKHSAFPPVEKALRQPNGLLAAGGDLSPERLLAAYRQGIFPWFSPGEPILWWSPDPRMVLFPERLKISRSLRKTLRKGVFQVSFDRAFPEVMAACAAPRPGQNGTWITPEMRAAYTQLHRLGHAHSVECRQGLTLVGGLYGIAIGHAFFGESMFSRVDDASKVALVFLVELLKERGFGIIDCQMATRHLASLGAEEIPRAEFSRHIAMLGAQDTRPGPWHQEHHVLF